MANPSRKHTGRSADPDRSKMSMDAEQTSKSTSTRRPKLDSVTDAPESGEPREQGYRIIEKGGPSKTPSQEPVARPGGSSARSARSNPKGPRSK